MWYNAACFYEPLMMDGIPYMPDNSGARIKTFVALARAVFVVAIALACVIWVASYLTALSAGEVKCATGMAAGLSQSTTGAARSSVFQRSGRGAGGRHGVRKKQKDMRAV